MKRQRTYNCDYTEPRRTMNTLTRCFSVKPFKLFEGKFPNFRQPIEFGFFSLDGRNYFDDNHKLRYYAAPNKKNLNFDLRDGYQTCIKKNEDVKERLDNLLRWIEKHRDKFTSQNDQKFHRKEKSSLNTDFVSWRGHFTKFMCSPYENRDSWKMAATLYNGTIYISEVETEAAYNDRTTRSARQEEMCYWGYRFEHYVTKPIRENSEETSTSIINTNEAFGTVVRTRLNTHSILMGAEVDCCDKNNCEKPPKNYIELKTTRIMDSYKQQINFHRYKMLKFWAQSFLVGLPTIIVGLRNDDGIVKELKTYKTLEIPLLCKEFPNHWKADVCMNFLDKFLTWMKSVVLIDNKNVVYMIKFESPFNVVTVEVITDGSERFIPDWFA